MFFFVIGDRGNNIVCVSAMRLGAFLKHKFYTGYFFVVECLVVKEARWRWKKPFVNWAYNGRGEYKSRQI